MAKKVSAPILILKLDHTVVKRGHTEARTSYRNGRNTEALIIENLEPGEITKKIFQHHLNILKNV